MIEKRPNNDELVSIIEELSKIDSEAEIDKFDRTILMGRTKLGKKLINQKLGIDKKRDELWDRAYEQMVNVLENYTISNSKFLQRLKKRLEGARETRHTMMSGSGPTIFAILDDVNRKKYII